MIRARIVASVVVAVAFALGRPAFAQVDFSGSWVAQYHEDFNERVPGPDLADYLGLPINAAARLRADTWDASLLTLPEYQCRPHPSDYGDRHSHVRIWREVDTASQELIAFRTHREWQAQERWIYMDGRPHPPEWAAHTWQGFSTGKWDGNTLTVTTTHLKASYVRRNGVARSDLATVTEHFMRHDLGWLTIFTLVTDPVYLTEPFARSSDYKLDNTHVFPAYPCQSVVEVERPQGVVPHHLPGTNQAAEETAAKYHLPIQPLAGGAETMYPEYQVKLKTMTPVAKGTK